MDLYGVMSDLQRRHASVQQDVSSLEREKAELQGELRAIASDSAALEQARRELRGQLMADGDAW